MTGRVRPDHWGEEAGEPQSSMRSCSVTGEGGWGETLSQGTEAAAGKRAPFPGRRWGDGQCGRQPDIGIGAGVGFHVPGERDQLTQLGRQAAPSMHGLERSQNSYVTRCPAPVTHSVPVYGWETMLRSAKMAAGKRSKTLADNHGGHQCALVEMPGAPRTWISGLSL